MTDTNRLVIVDDEVEIVRLIAELMSDHPYEIVTFVEGEEALRWIEKEDFNVIVTDLKMRPVDGLQIMRSARENNPLCEIIMITGFATIDSSIEALRGKVFDFLEKPINLEQLERSVQNAFRRTRLARENAELVERLSKQNELLEKQVEEATRELQDQTVKDYLTGLNNYRFFINSLTTEISRSVRYNRSLSLVMLDLDFFKRYNDALGHLAGNQALRTVAHIIRSQVRENDMVVRYGGEEFAIILPETTKKEAVPIVTRIQASLRERNFSYRLSNDTKALLTISAGIADYPSDADELDSLVRKADDALYKAKQAGRDHLVLAGQQLAEVQGKDSSNDEKD